MSETNSFKLSKASKIWILVIVLVAVIGLVFTFCADKKYYKENPVVPQVPTEIVDSVHNANK